jgi:hydrogenase maturation protease
MDPSSIILSAPDRPPAGPPLTLIIGVGNTLRADDGAGWHVARQLLLSPLPPQVEVAAVHQLTPELSEPLSLCRTAIFIDAALHVSPGALSFLEIFPDGNPQRDTHHFPPSVLMRISRDLYGRCPRAFLLAIGVGSFEFHSQPSPPVQAAISRAAGFLRRIALAGASCGPPPSCHPPS